MHSRTIAFLIAWLSLPSVALAGMGSPLLKDVAQTLRLTDSVRACLEAISLFVVVLLISALMVRWLWNGLARDFARLPRLTYGKSLAVVSLWGLMFLVVLTLIATARELMTPGAWEKVGLLYRVNAETPAPHDPEHTAERKQQLQQLHSALLTYAAQHDGRFPAAEDPVVAASLWDVPGGGGMRYVYVSGLTVQGPAAILVAEPGLFGDDRFVLRTNGEIALVPSAGLRKQFSEEKKP